jgi:hypothetical protein
LGAVAEYSCREVQARLFSTYRREYKNFTHLPVESIDAMFQRFMVIVNNISANVVVLPYDHHDRAVKLLHSLDRSVWSGKVEAILESEKYEILTVDELFSKLKSSEVDRGVLAKIENPTDPLFLTGGFFCAADSPCLSSGQSAPTPADSPRQLGGQSDLCFHASFKESFLGLVVDPYLGCLGDWCS